MRLTRLVRPTVCEGEVFEQEYVRGKPKADVKKIGSTDIRGTHVTFKRDHEIFETLIYKYETLAARCRELSYSR